MRKDIFEKVLPFIYNSIYSNRNDKKSELHLYLVAQILNIKECLVKIMIESKIEASIKNIKKQPLLS